MSEVLLPGAVLGVVVAGTVASVELGDDGVVEAGAASFVRVVGSETLPDRLVSIGSQPTNARIATERHVAKRMTSLPKKLGGANPVHAARDMPIAA